MTKTFTYRSGNGSNATEWRLALPTDTFLTSRGWDGQSEYYAESNGNWVEVQEDKTLKFYLVQFHPGSDCVSRITEFNSGEEVNAAYDNMTQGNFHLQKLFGIQIGETWDDCFTTTDDKRVFVKTRLDVE